MNNIKIKINTSDGASTICTFTENDFKSLKFSEQLMDTSFDINPTVIEQYAEIELKDKGGVISSLVASGVLSKDLKVWISIDNVAIQTYLTSSWDVQIQNTTVKLCCNDPVKKIENKQTKLIEPDDYTLDYFLTQAFSWLGYNFEYETNEIRTIAQSIILKDAYVPYMDLLTFIKKLCITGFFRIYWYINKFIIARCF